MKLRKKQVQINTDADLNDLGEKLDNATKLTLQEPEPINPEEKDLRFVCPWWMVK